MPGKKKQPQKPRKFFEVSVCRYIDPEDTYLYVCAATEAEARQKALKYANAHADTLFSNLSELTVDIESVEELDEAPSSVEVI